MTNNLRKGIKMLSYGYKIKTNVLAAFIFMAIGYAIECISKGTTFLGGYFIMITPIWISQILVTSQLSSFVKSSKYRRAFETWMPAFINTAVSILLFTSIIIIRAIHITNHPQNASGVMFGIIWVAAMGGFFMIYSALVFKAYWISLVMFFIVYFTTFNTLTDASDARINNFALSFGMTIAIGYLIVIAGGVLQYICSCIVYKYPVSKRVVGAFARKKFS